MVVMLPIPSTLIIICLSISINTQTQTRGLFQFLFNPCRCKCGLPNREAKFLGGEYLRTHEFPWLSLIQIKGQNSIPATIINNKYVITTASNVIGSTPFDLKVTLGVFDRCFTDTSSTNVSVDKIIIHPDYTPANGASDLALIRLAQPITFERRISPICLSIPGNEYLGQVATIAAWTENELDKGQETASCRPRKLGLPVLNFENCFTTVTDKGCIGVVGTLSVVCKDDSGGPVMYRSHSGIYELIGILSEHNQCGNNQQNTALYTEINKHLNWITKSTKDACYCFKT